ncbi:MAG: glycosyltransferase family 2 protein [Magnetococcales bacterium]|nr:glycosyltransferase family 2 protein [Magnetococcales bacterium]
MTTPPPLGILILNWNGKRWLETLLPSLAKQSGVPVRLYLVDNASTDDSLSWVEEHHPEVIHIRFPQNLGYSMAYNLAMPIAFDDGCDWVIWANNDLRLEEGCLQAMQRATESSPCAILGPAFLDWESDQPNGYMCGKHPQLLPAMRQGSREVQEVDWVEGSFLMVNRACVQQVGALDPFLFFYWEETDFCRRARYQGFRVGLVPNALARHFAGGSMAQNQAVNRLKSRNYYIYKLADPNRSFLANTGSALHLFLARCRQFLFRWQWRPLLAEGAIFGGILRDLLPIHGKWRRDRERIRPPLTTSAYAHITPTVIYPSPSGER